MCHSFRATFYLEGIIPLYFIRLPIVHDNNFKVKPLWITVFHPTWFVWKIGNFFVNPLFLHEDYSFTKRSEPNCRTSLSAINQPTVSVKWQLQHHPLVFTTHYISGQSFSSAWQHVLDPAAAAGTQNLSAYMLRAIYAALLVLSAQLSHFQQAYKGK